jgi:photosystem II stability/assembly factor-like uncharacterized protein
VSKWKLWADVIVGWLLIAAVVLFIKIAIPRLQKRALTNDPRVPAGVQWTALGPIWGGDISALASSPDGLLYAGTASGAIYRSLDAGAAWELLCRTESGNSVTRLMATSAPMTLIVRAVEREGLQESYDDGHSWRQSIRGLGDDAVTALVQSGDGTALYAATANHGIYASKDIGRHWRKANTGLPTLSISCLLVTPPGDDRLFTGTYDQGVFVASAADLTWKSSSSGLSETPSVTALAWDESRPDTIVAVLHNEDVYVSTDTGQNWTAAAELPVGSGTVSAITIVPQPSWHLVVATSTGNVYAAADPSKGWKTIPPTMRGFAMHALCRSASVTLMAGTSGGVFKTDIASWQWTDVSTGIQEAEITCVAPDPADRSRVYAGTTGGMYVSQDAGATWQRTAAELDSQDIAVIRAGTPMLAGTRRAGLWMSADDMQWHRVAARELSDDVLALTPIASTPGRVLAGTSLGVWSVDLAKGTAIDRSLGLKPRGSAPQQVTYVEVSALATDPANEQHILAILPGRGLHESINGGLLWKDVQLMDRPMLGSTLDLSWLSSMFFASATRVYVGSQARGIWIGTPGGAWTPVNDGLSRIGVYHGSIQALAMDGAKRLYAATSSGGTFVLLPGGTRWLRMNLGLSSLGGQMLTVGADLRTLYCAMNGTVYVCSVP